MVHRLLVLLLICSLFAENVSRMLITAAFELNRPYIAEYLCINKDKPMLHCDGKCYLARKLKEAEEKEKKSEKESLKISYQPASVVEKTVLTFPASAIEKHETTDLPFHLPSRPAKIFHPPRA
ncbi:hypothetical protein [Parapedobacter defluvii]|uniref:hypothetical protein n=1 Tax=Parapedobacter defluvii TaxID=2045106 RepID=UPI000FAD4AC3|nr:MAG: hypothetical protein EAS52_04490 [Parapedobacter sp.]